MENTTYVRKENFVLIFIILIIACSVILLFDNSAYSGYVSRTYSDSTVASDVDSLSRSFSVNPTVINSLVNVTLTKSLVSSRTAMLIEEYVPSEFTIVDSASGTVINNTIRWGELQNVISGTITYSVMVSSTPSAYEFSGMYSIDGASAVSTSGDDSLNVSDESLNIVNESLSIINVSISITNTDINYSVNGSRNNGNFSNVTFNNNRGRIRFNNLLLSKNLSINDSVMNISKGKSINSSGKT